jgi:hypothetical protein
VLGRHRGPQTSAVEELLAKRRQRRNSEQGARAAFVGLIFYAITHLARLLPSGARLPASAAVALVVFTALGLWESRQQFTRSRARHQKRGHRR